jgi:hypothetical protein
MERLSENQINELYSDTLKRIELLYDDVKTKKTFLDEFYKRFITNTITSSDIEIRKKFVKLIEDCKTGILDLRTEVPKFLKENKKNLSKYSFESSYNYVKKIENTKVDNTKVLKKGIDMIISRLNTMSNTGHKRKYYKLLNKFYFVSNNYLKVILVDKKSDKIFEWLLKEKSPIKGI